MINSDNIPPAVQKYSLYAIGREGQKKNEPVLDLNFAYNKSLVDDISGNNLITFSRTSIGTFVDSDGLIKNSAVNLLTYSEEFNNSAWFKVNVPSVTVNDTLDPNGDQTADLISRTTNQTIAYQLSPGAGTYVFSVYAKAGSSNLVTLASSVSFRGAAVTFDLSTGVPGSVVNYYSGSDASIALSNPAMTDAGNGWWRCQVNVAHTGFRAVHVEPGDLTNTAASAYFWGAQLEEGSFPTSYIPTTGTPGGKTREADEASIVGTEFSSWWNKS